MTRVSKAFALALLCLILAGPAIGEEIVKEGSGENTLVYTGTFTALPMGKERLQMNYESFGVIPDATPESPIYNSTVHCLGSLHGVKGIYENDSGLCSYTRPDGDMIFVTYKATGKLGGQGGKGTWSFVGGTGKFVEIQGGGEFDRLPGFRPSGEGTFQGMNKSRGQWKLP